MQTIIIFVVVHCELLKEKKLNNAKIKTGVEAIWGSLPISGPPGPKTLAILGPFNSALRPLQRYGAPTYNLQCI